MFRHWLRQNPMNNAVFELKQTKTNSLPFDAVKEHQINALLACSSPVGFLYKIADDSSVSAKPFDMFYYRNADAYVVIKYPKSFSIISISNFLLEKSGSKKRSLTELRAKEISAISVDLKH